MNDWHNDRVTWNLDTGQYQIYTNRLARMHANAARAGARRARKHLRIATTAAIVLAALALVDLVSRVVS